MEFSCISGLKANNIESPPSLYTPEITIILKTTRKVVTPKTTALVNSIIDPFAQPWNRYLCHGGTTKKMEKGTRLIVQEMD